MGFRKGNQTLDDPSPAPTLGQEVLQGSFIVTHGLGNTLNHVKGIAQLMGQARGQLTNGWSADSIFFSCKFQSLKGVFQPS